MKRIFRLIPLLAPISLLMQCATTEPYPETWSTPTAIGAGECADVSGTFSNACIPASEYGGNCLETGGLAGLLLGKYAGSFHTRFLSADRVVVSQPSPSQLTIEVWDDEELVEEGEVQVDPEDCTPHGIVIGSGLKGTQIEGGIGTGSSRAVFSKNEEGDLIARTRVKFTGVWFVLPVSGSSQSWDRFERLPEPEEENTEVDSLRASAGCLPGKEW